MKKPPKIVMDLVRALLGIGMASALIYYLITSNDVKVVDQFLASSKSLVLLGFVCYGLGIVLTTARWKVLLDVQGVRLPLWQLYKLTMIGVFFSLILPGGAVGGDVLKMVYIANRAPDRKSECVLTIMLDRVFGLLGLMVMALVAVVLNIGFLQQGLASGTPVGQVVVLGTAFVGICCVGGIVAVLCASFHHKLEKLPGIRDAIRIGGQKLPEKVTGIILRLVSGFDLYREHRGALARALGLSLIVHLVLSLGVFSLGRAFHEKVVPPQQYFLAVQVANTVSGVPGFPGGIGGRDVVLAKFLEQGGATEDNAGMVPVAYSMVIALWSLIGGVFFMFTRMLGDATGKEEEDSPPEAVAT